MCVRKGKDKKTLALMYIVSRTTQFHLMQTLVTASSRVGQQNDIVQRACFKLYNAY